MPLQLVRPHQHLLLAQRQLEEVVGGVEAGDDRRRARPQPARQRDLAAKAEGDAVGRVEALEGADEKVVAPGRDVEAPRLELELAGLLDFELEEERHRRRHRVVARSQVGGGGGNADEAAARGHR